MPGSKSFPHRSSDSVLDEPWNNPQGHENEVKRMHRALLPDGYPDDLSRDSRPASEGGGSIGTATHPISHRKPPFKLKGDR